MTVDQSAAWQCCWKPLAPWSCGCSGRCSNELPCAAVGCARRSRWAQCDASPTTAKTIKATRPKPCRQQYVLGMRLQHVVYHAYFLDARFSKVVNCYFCWKWEKNSTSYPSKVLAFAKQTFETKSCPAAADGTSCFESLQKCQKAQELFFLLQRFGSERFRFLKTFSEI